MGMGWPQQLDVRLDGKLLKRFTVGGGAKGRPAAASYAGDGEPGFAGDPEWEKYMQVGGDAGLEIRVPVEAGPHVVGVVVRQGDVGAGRPAAAAAARPGADQRPDVHGLRERRLASRSAARTQRRGVRRRTRRAAARFSSAEPAARESDERDVRHEDSVADRPAGLSPAGRRRPTCRRCSSSSTSGRRDGGSFDAGIQFALERMLVDPDFLLRVHRDPPARRPESGGVRYRLSDLEVASRLSFFLWSSIPDERLLDLAERGQLTRPAMLEQQVRRMLADPRADACARRRLRRAVAESAPRRRSGRRSGFLSGLRRQPARGVQAGNRAVRRQHAARGSQRARPAARGLHVRQRTAGAALRHSRASTAAASAASRCRTSISAADCSRTDALLATTSYPDRTSPVLRGKWLLDNIFGAPVPPPPPGVDTTLPEPKPGAAAADDPRAAGAAPARTRLCSSCHSVIDPLGFALENFDAIGGWRTVDESGKPVDASGTTVSGATIEGLSGLRGAAARAARAVSRAP